MDAVLKIFVVKGLDSTTSTTVLTNVLMAKKLVYRDEGFLVRLITASSSESSTLMKLDKKQLRDKTHPLSSFKSMKSQNQCRFDDHLHNQYVNHSGFKVYRLLARRDEKAWCNVDTCPVNLDKVVMLWEAVLVSMLTRARRDVVVKTARSFSATFKAKVGACQWFHSCLKWWKGHTSQFFTVDFTM